MDYNNDMIFANNLKRILESKNLTASFLADSIGVSKATVSDWLKGKKSPRMDKIEKIRKVLNCTRADLMEEVPEGTLDAIEEEVIRMFRELDNRQKITLYNTVKILYDNFKS